MDSTCCLGVSFLVYTSLQFVVHRDPRRRFVLLKPLIRSFLIVYILNLQHAETNEGTRSLNSSVSIPRPGTLQPLTSFLLFLAAVPEKNVFPLFCIFPSLWSSYYEILSQKQLNSSLTVLYTLLLSIQQPISCPAFENHLGYQF